MSTSFAQGNWEDNTGGASAATTTQDDVGVRTATPEANQKLSIVGKLRCSFYQYIILNGSSNNYNQLN